MLDRFHALRARRLAGEPIAHILGFREFYGRRFKVNRHVLIPRPETELLIDLALERANRRSDLRLLDVGTGSGCIAITMAIEARNPAVTAIDNSAAALDLARTNARLLDATLTFIQADIGSAEIYSSIPEPFDLILGNLPYISSADPHLTEGDLRFEPMQALTDGNNGFSLIGATIAFARTRLAFGGWVVLEHGYNQGAGVRDMLMQAGFTEVATHRDLAGTERVSLGFLGHCPAPI